ncbi:MAG: hypothetical protein ACJAS9_002520 [Polaribacter sp.]
MILTKIFKQVFVFLAIITLLFSCSELFAHGVDENTKKFLIGNDGVAIFPYLYIGAKHMVTGYDHLLFILGVIFFLYCGKDILIYVSLFTLGHSITLLSGVLADIQMNAYLIDAVIGFSIIYKGFDNLGGFKKLMGYQPNTKLAVLIFGLFHGFGLATKIQEFEIAENGLISNLVAFNIGVEIGQVLALGLVMILLAYIRKSPVFNNAAVITNTALMSAGLMLMLFQLTSYAFQ